jgi:hypothetical protein
MHEELRSQLWSAANNIDELKHKLKNAADVIEIIASSDTAEPNSGALWFVRDSMIILCELIDIEIDKLMEVSRQAHEEANAKKKKK